MGIQAVDKIPGGVSGGFELNFFQFLLIGTLIGYCFHKLLIKQTLPKVALTAMAVCLMFISWKREAKFEKNEFQVFSAKTFCGMIQYNGKLITFTEDSSGNRQVLQIFKNAVRNAGLNPEKSIILKSRNKLLLNGKQICFLKENNGWKFKIGEQEFNYLSKGTPGKDHPKELLSQRLQYYLYREEKIKPFRIAI